jgi:2-dehydro-3-deoxygluconokinase
LNATFGGGEANVAVSLAQFGFDSHFVTRLPENALGDAALRSLRAERVNVDSVVRGGRRVGIYFTETGASQRPSQVIYDRLHSAVCELEPNAVRWSEVLQGSRWFHTTGITPALGSGVAECAKAALLAAREAGAKVSFDLNYRRLLWSEEQARRVVGPLMRHVHLLVGNEEDLQTVLGVPVRLTDVTKGRLDVDAYRAAAEQVVAEYGVEQVAITLRESLSASENGWSALLYDGVRRVLHRAPRYVLRLVDRIGGGDAFAAGLIFSQLDGRAPEDALRFAVAASALKQTIVGDYNRVSIEEVERLAGGDESGRVRR